MNPWSKIIRAISKKQVLPIVGPGLTLLETPDGNIPIRDWLAPRLATALCLPASDGDLNSVACQHLIRGGNRSEIYEEISVLVDDLLATHPNVPQPLRDLAAITDLDIIITSSFDPFLGRALEIERPGYRYEAPDGFAAFHPNKPVDVPAKLNGSFLYHVLGTHDTFPDFGVWEEDYVEFTCGLLKAPRDVMRHLFEHLNNRSLLFIGSPFNDWIVRFFLRIAKDKRLSDQTHAQKDYFAEDPLLLEKPMVFYLDQVLKSPQILPGSPSTFIAELRRQWEASSGGSNHEQLLASITSEPELGAIFISYSRDDQEAALNLASGLRAANLPVWLDTKRLKGGTDWENHLLRAVKTRSSLFLSLISSTTEKDDPDSLARFVHKERRWAAEKFVPGHIFYIPIIIEEAKFKPRQEPPAFAHLDRSFHLPGGQITSDFARQIKVWHDEYKLTREIRDV